MKDVLRSIKLTNFKICCLFINLLLFYLIVFFINTTTFYDYLKVYNKFKIRNSSFQYSITLSNDDYSAHIDKDMIERDFSLEKDVIVLLHIQKTGGIQFEKRIFQDLTIRSSQNRTENLCMLNANSNRFSCRVNTHGKPVFWNRYTSGYCDMHANYVELKNCVMFEYGNRIIAPFNRFPLTGILHFITMLRNPIDRYISEYNHVQKGATWKRAVRVCTDEFIYKQKCYDGFNWTDVTWSEFLTCEYNLANNRQVRMLANYNQHGCRLLRCLTKAGNCTEKEKDRYDKLLLESAKQTLLSFSFFGLTEYQALSQQLFEKTFQNKLVFSTPLEQLSSRSNKYDEPFKSTIRLIQENNKLDIQLYEFAKNIFFSRIKAF